MNEHNVILRHYKDGSIGVHARKNTGENRVDIHEGWAFASPDVMSDTYVKIRNGELDRVETVITGLSKAEAQSAKRYIIAYLLSQNTKVVNPNT